MGSVSGTRVGNPDATGDAPNAGIYPGDEKTYKFNETANRGLVLLFWVVDRCVFHMGPVPSVYWGSL
jgi:hypothetical protein